MKKGSVFILSVVVFLVASVSVVAMQNGVVVTENKFEKKDETISVKLSIPQISGMGNKQKEKIINENFDREANEAYKNIEKQAKEDYVQAKKDNLFFAPYEVDYGYVVTYNNNGVLSVPVEIYTYAGGAHGITDRKSNNFDVNTGDKILLKDLFKGGYDYKAVLNKVVMDEINKNKDNYFEGSFKGIRDDGDYYLTKDGIVLYFQLYEIAPYAAGIPEFIIPYSMVDKGLKYKLSK